MVCSNRKLIRKPNCDSNLDILIWDVSVVSSRFLNVCLMTHFNLDARLVIVWKVTEITVFSYSCIMIGFLLQSQRCSLFYLLTYYWTCSLLLYEIYKHIWEGSFVGISQWMCIIYIPNSSCAVDWTIWRLILEQEYFLKVFVEFNTNCMRYPSCGLLFHTELYPQDLT